MSEAGPLFYPCPCCRAHTLESPQAGETCPLCNWRSGETDAEYSLNEARENVRAYTIAYRPSDERFARLRHPILGPAGETAIDRVALRQRMYAEFAQFAKGRAEPLTLSQRLQSLLTILREANSLYVVET